MLVNYFMSDLTAYIPSTAYASLVAFTVVALLLGLVIHRVTKNSVLSYGIVVAAIVSLLVIFFVDSSLLAGKFNAVIEWLSLFERFYVFVDGVFDVTGIVYFVSIGAIFLFLTIQAMEKRRWTD